MFVNGLNVSSYIEIIVWKPEHDFLNNIEDSISSNDKHLWYGKVELLNGEIAVSGDISRDAISIEKDPLFINGYKVVIDNKQINIDLSSDVNGVEDEIIVEVNSDGGFSERNAITSVLESTSENSDINFIVFPNPTNDMVSINFEMNKSGNNNGKINLYGYNGQLLTSIFEGDLTKFNNSFSFSQNNIPSGIYFVSVETNGQFYLNKVVFSK